jgi:hypothetical protein
MGGCERGCRNVFLKLSAGCMVTKLKVLSFFRALSSSELARDLKALSEKQVSGKAVPWARATFHGQGPGGRWQSAASSEGGRVRCSVASTDGSAEAAADCGARGAGSAYPVSLDSAGGG